MESYLSQWIVDLSVLCSIAGLIWTGFVWNETKKIRNDFLFRIRFPNMVKDLRSEVQSLLSALAEWEKSGEHTKATSSIASLKGILLSLKLKTTKDDLKQVEVVIAMIEGRSEHHRVPGSEASKKHAWRLSQEANTLVTLLGQREKDIRWVS